MPPSIDDDIARAQRELEELITQAEGELAETDELLEEIEAKEAPASEEEVEALREFATGPQAPREWKRVAELVDRGQLTWRDVADGKQTHDILAAINATARLRLDPDDFPVAPPAEPPAAPHPGPGDWDDEDFSNNTFLR